MGREGWPSGKMSDCNARGREFKSWSGQNKFTKSNGQCHGDTCAPIDHPAVPRHWPPTHCRCETPQSTELLLTVRSTAVSRTDNVWAANV